MDRELIYCNTCKRETWHESVAVYAHDRYDYLWGFSQRFESAIFKCCGCEDISFRIVKHPFEFQNENDEPEIFVYPDRGFKFRERIFIWKLPKNISQLYHETVQAHDAELIVLATVGVRALIEAIVANKIPRDKYANNLESKIEALKPHFSSAVIETLHEFRRMGNVAAHELEAPKSINIHHALYVVEGVLEYFYGIDNHAKMFNDGRKKVQRRTPTRR